MNGFNIGVGVGLKYSTPIGKIRGGNISYPGLIAAWSAKGKSNDDEDRAILKDLTGNGHDITLNGFAFNTEGSGYGHPEYPDALVFDGVDDYGINEDMSILTDYTVICDREIISWRIYGAVMAKCINVEKNGAFIFEIPFYSDNRSKCSSFVGNLTNVTINNKRSINYLVKNKYNGITEITPGTGIDGTYISIGNLRGDSRYSTSIAFYSAYLFDRSLDEQEIKSFIRKYIDPEYLLPSEIEAINNSLVAKTE